MYLFLYINYSKNEKKNSAYYAQFTKSHQY